MRLGLLALLVLQDQAFAPRPLAMPRRLLALAWAVAGLTLVQVALGGWVSTNYAVLACREFPTCQGLWWPQMDFAHAFTIRRELGQTGAGEFLPFAALTAIHVAHRLAAVIVLAALAWLVWRLHATGDATLRRFGTGLALLGLWQLVTGLSNVVLGWPLVAALVHTAGAALLTMLLTSLLVRAGLRASTNARTAGHAMHPRGA